jgi:hypothetical protein
LLKVVKGQLLLMGKWNTSEKAETIIEINFSQEYPKVVMDRQNSKEVSIFFNFNEYAKLVLQNHKIRDVLYLVAKKTKEQLP